MVATSVLLNGGVAFGAFFGIRGYPVRGFRIVFAFLQPPPYKRTCRGLVVVQGASEAELMPAIAVHRRHDLIKVFLFHGALYRIFTVRSWAPLKVLFIIDVSSGEENVISGIIST